MSTVLARTTTTTTPPPVTPVPTGYSATEWAIGIVVVIAVVLIAVYAYRKWKEPK